MKRKIAVAALLISIVAGMSSAQEQVTRIALVNSNIPSGAIFKGIDEHCQGVVLTVDASKATFQLEAQINKESESRNERSWLTLFNSKDDAIYATDTRGTGNAVKDVCEFLKLGKR
jgi:Skp family chaperone for outer membrane proteins